jgi:hypothetical protein
MAEKAQWTGRDVPAFLGEHYRGDVTLVQLVAEARRHFPDRAPSRGSSGDNLVAMEVDRYIERFVLDVLRITTGPHLLEALLSVATPRGVLANVTRP